jgi:hypothetical protein
MTYRKGGTVIDYRELPDLVVAPIDESLVHLEVRGSKVVHVVDPRMQVSVLDEFK